MIKICKNTKNYKLTEGKEYEIEEVDGNYVKLVNDSGKLVRYDASLFEDAIPPAPPAPRIRTEAQIINSIAIDDDNIVTFNDRLNNEVRINVAAITSITGAPNSCGISMATNLNGIINSIEGNVNTEHDDYVNLKKAIFTACINKMKQSVRNGSGLITFSTNQNEAWEDYFNWLTELSITTTGWFRNPNSGNQINVWNVRTQ
jgi:hypothetical protein